MEYDKLIRTRYSARALESTSLSDEQIDRIVESAIAAPTAVNRQPFRIFVMRSESAQEKIKQVTSCTFGASTFFVVGYKEEGAWVREYDKRNFADVDASIVATHMMLEIEDMGLGTTWVGWFDAPKLRSLCPEMEGYELIAIFPVGKKAAAAEPSLRHSLRKTRDEVVTML